MGRVGEEESIRVYRALKDTKQIGKQNVMKSIQVDRIQVVEELLKCSDGQPSLCSHIRSLGRQSAPSVPYTANSALIMSPSLCLFLDRHFSIYLVG